MGFKNACRTGTKRHQQRQNDENHYVLSKGCRGEKLRRSKAGKLGHRCDTIGKDEEEPSTAKGAVVGDGPKQPTNRGAGWAVGSKFTRSGKSIGVWTLGRQYFTKATPGDHRSMVDRRLLEEGQPGDIRSKTPSSYGGSKGEN